jgi:hypothetical protein
VRFSFASGIPRCSASQDGNLIDSGVVAGGRPAESRGRTSRAARLHLEDRMGFLEQSTGHGIGTSRHGGHAARRRPSASPTPPGWGARAGWRQGVQGLPRSRQDLGRASTPGPQRQAQCPVAEVPGSEGGLVRRCGSRRLGTGVVEDPANCASLVGAVAVALSGALAAEYEDIWSGLSLGPAGVSARRQATHGGEERARAAALAEMAWTQQLNVVRRGQQ